MNKKWINTAAVSALMTITISSFGILHAESHADKYELKKEKSINESIKQGKQERILERKSSDIKKGTNYNKGNSTATGKSTKTLGTTPTTPRPDYRVVPAFKNSGNLPEGFPKHSYCYKDIALPPHTSGGTPNSIIFHIENIGSIIPTAPLGSIVVTYQTNTGIVTDIQPIFAPAQPFGGKLQFNSALPDNCYTSPNSGICQFSIKADINNEVIELNENNNQAQSFCVSPAG